MRSLKLLILIILLYTPVNANMKNAFDFKFNSIDGEEINLSKYKGKTILVVNVASKCGFTNQYEGLQSLSDKYKKKDFVVIGVSSNDFNQELQNKEEVKKFCEVNFGINFPNLYELTLIILAALLGATAFIFISYGYSIAKGHFARTGVMGFIQLPASIVLGFFIFNESLKFNAYFGSLLIIIAGVNAIYGLKNDN